jgi:hypothetical protein
MTFVQLPAFYSADDAAKLGHLVVAIEWRNLLPGIAVYAYWNIISNSQPLAVILNLMMIMTSSWQADDNPASLFSCCLKGVE